VSSKLLRVRDLAYGHRAIGGQNDLLHVGREDIWVLLLMILSDAALGTMTCLYDVRRSATRDTGRISIGDAAQWGICLITLVLA
jgi:hypothetical protein